MNRIGRLPSSSVEYLRRIVGAKRHPHKKRLEKMLTNLEVAFSQLIDSVPEIPLIPVGPFFAFTGEDVASLESAYDVETPQVLQLKKDLRSAAGDTRVCCYCQIDDGPTFDHSLPISVWPEFSVCSVNLVPICGACNLLKLARFVDRHGRRLFLNVHFDDVPQVRWLFATASRRADKLWLTYSLEIPLSLPDGLRGLLARHYDELKLLGRYLDRTGDVLATFRATMSDQRPDQIRAKADNLRLEYGANYFKAAAFNALADLLESESQIAV